MTIERKGRPHNLEPIMRRVYAERDPNVLRLAFPLYKRNPQLPIAQATYMTGLTPIQIQHFLGILHEPEPTPTLDSTNGSYHPLGFTEDEMGSFAFTKELLTAGFITHETDYWESLHTLYTKHERVLPEAFTDKLRLEAFLKTMRVTKHGNIDLLEQYKEIATSNPISSEHAEYIQQEEEFITAKAGSIFIRIIYLWKQQKTAAEIYELTGLTPIQIHNSLGNARARGIIAHPTKKEVIERWQRANKGKPSPNKGKPQYVEYTLRAAETTKGAPLTNKERQKIITLTAIARKAIRDRHKVPLSGFYEIHNKPLHMEHVDRNFLEAIYAAWICRMDEKDFAVEMRKRSFVKLQNVVRIYQQVDPEIFDRRQKDIAFIAGNLLGVRKS